MRSSDQSFQGPQLWAAPAQDKRAKWSGTWPWPQSQSLGKQFQKILEAIIHAGGKFKGPKRWQEDANIQPKTKMVLQHVLVHEINYPDLTSTYVFTPWMWDAWISFKNIWSKVMVSTKMKSRISYLISSFLDTSKNRLSIQQARVASFQAPYALGLCRGASTITFAQSQMSGNVGVYDKWKSVSSPGSSCLIAWQRRCEFGTNMRQEWGSWLAVASKAKFQVIRDLLKHLQAQ